MEDAAEAAGVAALDGGRNRGNNRRQRVAGHQKDERARDKESAIEGLVVVSNNEGLAQ